MIKRKKHPVLSEVMPHAIFWRPLLYFSLEYRQEVDDLDHYEGATFEIGNQFTFDLRRYSGHPPYTVSLYLSVEMANVPEIDGCITEAVEGFNLPASAIAWRRGEQYTFGSIERKADDRLREPEARLIALKIAASYPGRRASMEQIKGKFTSYYELTTIDERLSVTRRGEKIWQQIVRNIVSHADSSSSIFSRGWATIDSGFITVSDLGYDYLKSIGFAEAD